MPGDTLAVDMWQMGPKTVVFRTRVLERPGAVAISNAAISFSSDVRRADVSPAATAAKL